MIKTELVIRKKEPLGSGIEHTAFPFDAFKDKIIKTKSGNVEIGKNGKPIYTSKDLKSRMNPFEIKTFQDHPSLFAKVYKATDRYAIIEKLNTKDINEDLEYLTYDMIRFFIANPFVGERYTLKNIEELEPTDFNILAELYGHKKDKTLYEGILKYASDKTFAMKLFKFIQTVSSTNLGKKADMHDGNIGYDKEKNIKLLDF